MMKHPVKRMLSLTLVLAMVVGLFAMTASAETNLAPTAPTGLLMELSDTPLGIESATPGLSWVVNDPDSNEVQTAYQILVATSEEKLTEELADMWDSGKVDSNQSSHVPYGGESLAAGGMYYWTVRTWDKDGAVSPFAEAQFFTTALKDTWEASAVWSGDDGIPNEVSVFEGAGLTDYVLEMDFTITDVALGVAFRKESNSTVEETMYMWQLRAESGSTPAILRPHVAKAANAFNTLGDVKLDQFGLSIKTGEQHHLKISAIGSEIKTYIDGVLVSTMVNDLYDEGTFGLRCGKSESGLVDNLKISKPDGTVVYFYTFEDGVNPFSGGSFENNALRVGKGNKIYHIVNSAVGAMTDYTLESDFTIDDVALGFSVRKLKDKITEENHCYMFQVRAASGDTPAQLQIREIRSSTNETYMKAPTVSLDTVGLAVNTGEKHHIKITCAGAEIKVWIDDVLCATVSDATEYGSGTFGIRCGGSESGTVDNLKVTAADGTVILDSSFDDGVNPFAAGGTVTGGALKVNKGEKLYYVDTGDGLPYKGNIVFLRKEFSLEKPVKKAIVSAIGLSRDTIKQYTFKLYVNGGCAGMGSPYPIRNSVLTNPYSTFDVTELVREGENAIGAICYAVADQRFQLQMTVLYEDGTTETLVTDETWMSLDGTNVYGDDGSIIGGNGSFTAMADNIDARKFPYGWNEPGFDETGWEPVAVKTTITGMMAAPIENMFEYSMPVQSIVDKGNGNYFLTLEKEIIGGLRLRLPNGVEGQTLTMLYGEEAKDNVVEWKMNTGNTYREYWTLKDGPQVIENFGMKGFRYIEIQNSPVEITADMVEGVAYRQDFDLTDASFESSNTILNDIFELVQYSMMATNQDIYTDSQTRERAPNNSGDVYINAKTSHAVSRDYTLAWYTTRYMNQLNYQISEYNIHAILTAWEMYKYLGDKSMLEADYARLVKRLRLDHLDEETGLFWFQTDTTFRDLVDWPNSERDGYHIYDCYYNTVVNSYQYKGLLTVADIAEVLGKTEDAETYRSMAADLKKAINDTFYNVNGDGLYIEGMKKDGTLVTGTATPATLYPLLHGLVDDPAAYEKAMAYVAGKGFTGSVFGAQFLLELLYQANLGDRAYELLTDTGLRSWYHMMYELGATITAEAWDPSRKPNMTFSHPWGSAAGNMMMEGLGGVTALTPGYETIRIKPQYGALEQFSLTTPTIKGPVSVAVDATDSRYLTQLTVTIPANTTAQVHVPAGNANSEVLFMDGEPVTAVRQGDYLVVEAVGSGTHSFRVPVYVKMTASAQSGVNYVGNTNQIELSVTDVDGAAVSLDKAEVTYTSNREDVAQVDETGLVTFVGAGSAAITATVRFTDLTVSGVTLPEVTLKSVVNLTAQTPLVSGLELRQDGLQLTLYAIYESGREEAVEPALVTFETSDPAVATVDASGKITELAAGDVTFTAKLPAFDEELAEELIDAAVETDEVLFADGFDTNASFPEATAADGTLTVGKSKIHYYKDGTNWSNYAVEATGKASSNAWSVNFYQVDAGNFYMWQLNEKEGNLKTHICRNGTFASLGTVPLGSEYHMGQYNDLRVEIYNGRITTYINGVRVHCIYNTELSAGSIGFRNGSTEISVFDEMTVTSLVLQAETDHTVVNVFDLNGDGIVNLLDMTRAQRHFGTKNPIADLDKSGEVDVADLVLILQNFTQ